MYIYIQYIYIHICIYVYIYMYVYMYNKSAQTHRSSSRLQTAATSATPITKRPAKFR